MDNKERFYPESLFGGFTDIDGTIAFFNRINALLKPDFTILDVGCGRGAQEHLGDFKKNLKNLKGKVNKVIGIDVDPIGQENQSLDEFRLIQNIDCWPVDSKSIDLIICDYVVEHVSNTEQFFSEIYRVLKPHGLLCIRTTNRWSYVAIAATLIPNKYHSLITSIVQGGRKPKDVFPTVYKCNTVRKLKRIMTKNSIDSVVYEYEAEPSYLSFSTIAYFFGVIHQKLAPSFIKPAIFAFGRMTKNIP